MPKWKDEKNYHDSDDIKGSAIKLGRFKLSIHRHIDYPADVWFASCSYLFNCVELASKDPNEAKSQAKAKLQVILEDAIKDILEIA